MVAIAALLVCSTVGVGPFAAPVAASAPAPPVAADSTVPVAGDVPSPPIAAGDLGTSDDASRPSGPSALVAALRAREGDAAPVRRTASDAVANASNATVHRVRLVTGQTVRVVRQGNRTAYLVDADEPMHRVTIGTRTYVYPAGVDFSTFDPDLFDVDLLLSEGVGVVSDSASTGDGTGGDAGTPGSAGSLSTAGGEAGSAAGASDVRVPVIVEFADRSEPGSGAGAVTPAGDSGDGAGAGGGGRDAVSTAAVSTLAGGQFRAARTLETLGAVGGTVPADAAAARALRTDPAVRRVVLDRRIGLALDSSTATIRAPAAREAYGTAGGNVTVAVLDTGIADDHPDIDDAVVAQYDATGEGRVDDPIGHGTHVAGTIAGDGTASNGTYVGVAPNASLLDVRVIGERGTGRLSWIVDGLEWAAARDADVASMSLGSTDPDSADLLARAVADATRRGTLVVAAAGNDGAFASVAAPGSAPDALTVGAVKDAGALATFSSRGPMVDPADPTPSTPEPDAPPVLKPDLVAPGVAVTAACPSTGSCGGDAYTAKRGTSMATPHVSGVAALVASTRPDWGPERLKAALVTSARPIGARLAGTDAPVADAGSPGGDGGGDRDGDDDGPGDALPVDPDDPTGAYGVGSGLLDAPRALGAPVVVAGGAVDFGARTERRPLERAVTIHSVDDEPVVLAVDATLAEVRSDESFDDAVSVNRSRVELPAGDSATIRVAVDALPDGLYAGRLNLTVVDGDGTAAATGTDEATEATATDETTATDEPYGVPIAVGRPHRLTIRKEPLAGTTVANDTVFAMSYAAFDPNVLTVRSLPAAVQRVDDGTVTVDSYGGRYLVWSAGRDESTGAQVLVHGTVDVDADASLTLSEAETVPYRLDAGAIEAREGPLANLTVQPTLQRFVDVPACGETLPRSRCEVEIELADATAVGRDSRTVRFTPDPDADASVEHLLVPAADWNGTPADPTLDAPAAYHLLHATRGIDGPETFVVEPDALARVNRTYRRASPTATYEADALVLGSVWNDNTDLGRLWTLGGRVEQAYYLTPETATYDFQTRYESPTTAWTTGWFAAPRTSDRYERAVNVHPFGPAIVRWSLEPGGARLAASPIEDQPAPRLDFAALADDATVSVVRNGTVVAADAGDGYRSGEAVPAGTRYRLRVEATQSAMPLSTRVRADYAATAVGLGAGEIDDRVREDVPASDDGTAGADGLPPRIERIALPVDGLSRVPAGPSTATITVASGPRDPVESVRVLYAPASERATPFEAAPVANATAGTDGTSAGTAADGSTSGTAIDATTEAGLVARGAWREATVVPVGEPDEDGSLTVRVRLDPGAVGAAGGRLHLAVRAVDDAGDATRLLVENATAVAEGAGDGPDEPAEIVVVPPTPAGNADDDPQLEDVDGDGAFTIFDVQAFLETFDGETVQAHPGAFDFDGDGDVDIFDVQALLVEL